MPAHIDARDEALRRAREGARVVLAKHPCVVAGCAARGPELRMEAERRHAGHGSGQVVGGQDAARPDGPRDAAARRASQPHL